MKTRFDERFLRDLAWLAGASRCSSGGLLAVRPTALPAGGAEWPTWRDYSPGDDYRCVDWNVCARHDEMVSRECSGGADRGVCVLVDCSRSMSVGEPSKFDLARRIAAALAAAALGRWDQLAMAMFADGVIDRLPPLRGSSRVDKVVRFLESQDADRAPSDLARTAETLVGRGHRRGPVVVLGDFLNGDSDLRGLRTLQYHGYSPRVVHVGDRCEEEPERLGDVELCDAESEARWTTTLCEEDLARYRALFAAVCRGLRTFCIRSRIPYLRVRNDAPWQRIVFEATGLRVPG